MSEQTKSAKSGHRIARPDSDALGTAQAQQVGADFQWHFGRITRLGIFGDGRSATVLWEEGGYTSLQGEITDHQWDILKLSFLSTGRIAILSDHTNDDWMYDYRFLEAVRQAQPTIVCVQTILDAYPDAVSVFEKHGVSVPDECDESILDTELAICDSMCHIDDLAGLISDLQAFVDKKS